VLECSRKITKNHRDFAPFGTAKDANDTLLPFFMTDSHRDVVS
jgi:hypothetical protein